MAGENGSRLLCVLFKLSSVHIRANHCGQSSTIPSAYLLCVCSEKFPQVDGSNEPKSIGCNRKTDPSRYSPTRVLTQHASLVSRAAVQARREMQRSQSLTLQEVGTFHRGEESGGAVLRV